MEKDDFSNLPRVQQEDVIMPEIIKILRKLGGHATTNEVKQALLEQDNAIPETVINQIKMGKKGQQYKPFNFPFNFSVTNLEIAGILMRPQRGEIELTKSGRQLNLDSLNIQMDIRAKSDPEWKRRHKQNLIKRQKSKNNPPVVNDSVEDTIVEDTIDASEQWRSDLLAALMQISPAKFELFSRLLVKSMGVKLDETIGIKLSGDGGLDGYGYLTTDDFRTARVAVQAKRWEDMVPSPEIDKFRGAMDKHNAEYGIFVTTADFSRAAISAARAGTRVITLINGERLIDLVAKYQLHVTPVVTYELDDFFKEKD
ncbi:restriction endonuclease [Loigolactobacillus backii]|uniref:restriction endonuclease n=1 Tax=Loigolactobacillus backii TaxID=375175 RepID=UPI0007F09F93|nr:restriction endonuclease [Loigolactobacillus backii]ANK59435.1 restriction endonuclease [Loigolactobacillus backii]ANK64428.1 restriction endonuclease [Loigolactobacillus backii]ANK67176.1 restriction endonuclease [Loigolactobacillus backii]OLF70758.1 hypothetical protein ACX53_00055 [Loigolactobacillus backii]PIO87821.1 restriction endonuclease [Loigolactobacillus backii]